MFRRKRVVILEVSEAEYRLLYESLLALRNRLIAQERYTAPVDEMLIKLMA